MTSPATLRSVAIVGGGITGLAAAFRLEELSACAIDLFEASGDIGGVLNTISRDGYLVEHSADMFTTAEPEALDLCRRLNYESELISPCEDHRRALLVHNGKLIPTPRGFSLMMPTDISAVIESGLLSEQGIRDLQNEINVPPRTSQNDESVAHFARRRFGEEIYAKYIQPMVGGIYTGDPEKLSMRATMAKFHTLEQKFGSLTAAGQQAAASDRQASGARYSLFRTPEQGMQHWMQTLAGELSRTTIRLNTQVNEIQQNALNAAESRWRLRVNDQWKNYDAVILATPANITGELVASIAPTASAELLAMEASSTAIVVIGHERAKISHPLDAFGFVVPACESRQILAASFASNKYPGRAPAGKVLIRVFVGGALQKELLNQTDEQLAELVRAELHDLLGMTGEGDFLQVLRWNDSMPQYNLGHLDRVAKIENDIARLPGLELAGKTFSGVGLPACIRSAEQAASRLLPPLQIDGE